MKFKAWPAILAIVMVILYAIVIGLLIFWYKSPEPKYRNLSYFPYLVQAGIFLTIYLWANEVRRLIFFVAMILLLASTYAILHFNYSKNDTSLDWKGLDGALSIFLVQGFISIFICLLSVSVAAGILKFWHLKSRIHKRKIP